MPQVQSPLHSITDLKPGDHACCIYDTDEEHRNIITPFLRKGLEQNEKVVYIADARDPGTIINYLKTDGIDVEQYQKKGQFSILTSTDTYLKGGVFNPDGMMSILSSDTQKALDQGYTALRVTAEMSWALRGLPGSERLIEYEDTSDIFITGSKFLALCQYDQRCFSRELLHDVLAVHPFAIIGTSVYHNFYYVPPQERAKENQSGNKLNSWISNLKDRKATEEALLESEETFKALAENANDGILVCVAGGIHTYANRRTGEITGYSVAELLKISMKDLAAPGEVKNLIERFRKRLSGEDVPHQYETLFIHKDGKSVPIELTAAKTFWHGQPADLVIIRDITERKQAEEALQKAHDELENRVQQRTVELNRAFERLGIEHQRLYDVLETLPVYICLLTPDYHIPFANKYFRETFGEPKGRHCYEFLFNRTEPCETCETYTVIKTRAPHHWYWTGPNGRDYDIYDYPFIETDGSLNILEMGIDITERKQAEESVRKSLNERELLLREVHHRVRNNLQIMLSLIRLQSRNIKDPNLLDTMGEFQNRIRAMAHVHERMYHTEDISRIDLSEICTFLGTSLFKSYKVDPQHIRLNVEMKDLQISIDSAIPISLIINELVSNSIKHAFPKGATGEITIEGRREADNLVLSIRDTGIGIPKDLDWMRSKQSLGLRLVVSLVEQLNGTIELDRTAGTAFNIVVHEK